MSSARRARGPAFLVLITALAFAPVAHGVLPKPGSSLQAHEHDTGGHDWHVELDVNNTSTRLATVVLYAQECDVTVYAQKVPLAHGGSFAADEQLPKGAGTWSVHGRFVSRTRATGTWSVTKQDCVTGARAFDTAEHSEHIMRGNPGEYPPAAITGGSKNARRLRHLLRASEATKTRFDTLKKAAKRGYVLTPAVRRTAKPCPGTWHLRKNKAKMWGKVLDPAAPQSLVYWCDSQQRWTLAAYMYRAPGHSLPSTFGNLLQWHEHGPDATWMTHLWMVPDVRAAFATCVPFNAFARFSIFSFEPYTPDAHIDDPCSDSDGLAGQDAGLHR
jgi:hypothetical protein